MKIRKALKDTLEWRTLSIVIDFVVIGGVFRNPIAAIGLIIAKGILFFAWRLTVEARNGNA